VKEGLAGWAFSRPPPSLSFFFFGVFQVSPAVGRPARALAMKPGRPRIVAQQNRGKWGRKSWDPRGSAKSQSSVTKGYVGHSKK